MKSKKVLIVVFIFFWLMVASFSNAQVFNEQGLKYLKLFNWIENQYIDTVNLDKISDAAIRELLHHLDPHSVYFTKDEVSKMNEPLQGSFEGIGVSFTIFKDTILVLSSFSGSPSEKIGIIGGDRIIKIDEVNVAGIGICKQTVQSKLRGNKYTSVNIDVLRRGINGVMDFTIIRDKIPIESVDASYMVDKNTGYIRLSRFSATSFNEISKIFTQFKAKGIENIILDLSGNTGGYLDIAISLTDEFLDNGKIIVYTEGIHQEKKEFYATNAGLFENGKLVVIIDENSASASEIFAGAIQDWDRGIIIGRRSYGKGLVQRQFTFPDESMIRLTVARYYTPSGRLIQKSYANGYNNYNNELGDRLKSGEIYSKDFKNIPDSIKFYTLKRNRVVYGGGGISPDINVPLDSMKYNRLYKTLIYRGIINSFVLEYIDRNRNLLKKRFNTFEDYKNTFVIDNKLFTEFVNYLKLQNVTVVRSELKLSKEQINNALKAHITKELWSLSEFYEVFNTTNPDFLKAEEVINNWDKYSN